MVRSVWYAAIHDITSTKERLDRIALTDSKRRTNCGEIDTLLHRMTDCAAGKLDPDSPRNDTQYTPPAHLWRLDHSPSVSHEAPAETRGNPMDTSPPCLL